MGDLRSTADTMRRPSGDLTEVSLTLDDSNVTHSDDAMNDDLDLSLPPTEDEVLEDENRVFAPPPRVAARFYRPSQARRRDSAASSRRNSISSAHSRRSSIQPVRDESGEQSKYVAQHLRRASFLEDRKARLADRAAHAEKVRLRAALAKATLRDTTQSEERALAAQQARERNLAEIVANCGEEVKKAKQIAEFMKEKREQDNLRLKAQMDERMAEAERRREEHRKNNAFRRSRGQSVMNRKQIEVLPRVTEQEARKLSDEEAVSRVQGWWRGVRRKTTIQEFNNLGLTVDGIRDTSFETVIELLAQEKVLMTTARLLQICGLEEGDPKSVEEMAAVRTFLSAFLILGHPNQVLANKDDNGPGESSLAAHRLPSSDLENPQLQDLIGKAKDLLVSFENILGRLTSANRYTMPPALEKTLPESYATFYNAFIAWKSRDSNALIEVMLLQFVELDAIFHTVKDATDDAATALYRQSIRENQLMLIVRIKKLAGTEKGKKMIFEAVSEARKARATKKKTGDAKPRLAESEPVDPSETAKSLVSTETQTPTPPATPSNKTPARPVIKGALNGLLPDNRVVVHELAINSEYRISAEEYRAQQAELAQPLYLQMRANMLDEDDHETKFKFFMTMAKNIKDKLQRLLKPGNAVFNLLEDILDLNLIQRQYVVGHFSYEKFFAAMASLLPQMCAPIRDEEVKDLVRNKISDGNILDRVEALNGFIDVMICDYINYMLKVAAPTLIETAAPYEAKRFAQDVESGVHGLGAAEAAWRSARSKVLGELQRRDPEGINHPRSRPTAERFYAQMLVDIFTKPGEARVDEIPEMFRLDVGRISKVSLLIQRIVTVGAILLQCKNILKRDARSPWKTEASRVMSVLEANHPFDAMVDGVMAALESGRSMPAATKVQLRGFVTRTLTATRDMYSQGADSRDPVLRLLLTRLRGNILSRLVPGSASDKVKVANNAGEKLASLGLSEFVENIRLVSDLLEKIGSVDRAAHSPWWDALALKIEQEETSASS